MGPEEVEKWIAVLRDLAITVIASMLFVAQVFWIEPNAILVGGGISLYGLPVALRADAWRRKRRNGNDSPRDDDPYNGPGGYYRA